MHRDLMPGLQAVLNLPSEAAISRVQCPACKHQFHPGRGDSGRVRAARRALDQQSVPTQAAHRPGRAPAAAPSRPFERASPALAAAVVRRARSSRRDSATLVCARVVAFVPRGVDVCPECAPNSSRSKTRRIVLRTRGHGARDSVPHRRMLLDGHRQLITPVFRAHLLSGPDHHARRVDRRRRRCGWAGRT